MSPWARARRRMRYARGDVENKYTLMTKRSYGEGRLLDKDHLADKPGLEDLNVTPAPFKETFWSTPAFRLVQFVVVYYLVYPAFLWVFRHCQTVASDEFDIVTGQIAPNGQFVRFSCSDHFVSHFLHETLTTSPGWRTHILQLVSYMPPSLHLPSRFCTRGRLPYKRMPQLKQCCFHRWLEIYFAYLTKTKKGPSKHVSWLQIRSE